MAISSSHSCGAFLAGCPRTQDLFPKNLRFHCFRYHRKHFDDAQRKMFRASPQIVFCILHSSLLLQSVSFPVSSFLILPSSFRRPNRQRRTAIHSRIRRLSLAITAFEAPFLRRTGRHPRPAGRIRLQEFCDLFFGKIGSLDARISFQDAPAIGENYEVKISTLIFMVKDADPSIIE
jgi:hypothetical protein